jgi:hypothetical protein
MSDHRGPFGSLGPSPNEGPGRSTPPQYADGGNFYFHFARVHPANGAPSLRRWSLNLDGIILRSRVSCLSAIASCNY